MILSWRNSSARAPKNRGGPAGYWNRSTPEMQAHLLETAAWRTIRGVQSMQACWRDRWRRRVPNIARVIAKQISKVRR